MAWMALVNQIHAWRDDAGIARGLPPIHAFPLAACSASGGVKSGGKREYRPESATRAYGEAGLKAAMVSRRGYA